MDSLSESCKNEMYTTLNFIPIKISKKYNYSKKVLKTMLEKPKVDFITNWERFSK